MKPVEELHTGNVLLSPLHVQLAPQYLGHPLTVTTNKSIQNAVFTLQALSYTNICFLLWPHLIEICAFLYGLKQSGVDGRQSDHLQPSAQGVGVGSLVAFVLVLDDQC